MYTIRPKQIFVKLMISLIFGISASNLFAQGQGTSARGGSPRPERVQSGIGNVSPTFKTASQSAECDPDEVDGTCPGSFSFTYGFRINARPREGGATSLSGGFAFAAYIHRRIFLEIDNDNFISKKLPDEERVSGIGDTTLVVGADILTQKSHPISAYVLYAAKVPTASESKGLGSGEVDHTIFGAVGRQVTFGKQNPRTAYFEFGIGNAFVARTNAQGFDSFPFGTVAWRQALDKDGRFILHNEIGGTFPVNDYDGDAYSLHYLQTSVARNIGFRAGARFGITSNLPRFGGYFSITFSGNLKQ